LNFYFTDRKFEVSGFMPLIKNQQTITATKSGFLPFTDIWGTNYSGFNHGLGFEFSFHVKRFIIQNIYICKFKVNDNYSSNIMFASSDLPSHVEG